jgi:hypothetical protein
MENISFSPSFISIVCSLLGILGVFIWFLVRIRVKAIWFPILRVLDLRATKLPKLSLIFPPKVPFFCFAMGVLLLSILSFKPANKKIFESPLEGRHFLAVIDLSPSVSEKINEVRYREILESFVDSLDAKTRLTLSISDRKNLVQSESNAGVKNLIRDLKFHSFGAKLGENVKQALSEDSSFTDIVVFSDQDSFTWIDFNWKFLSQDKRVSRIALSNVAAKPNVFLKEVRLQSSSDAKVIEWGVDIGASSEMGSKSVNLSVYLGEQLLVSQSVPFAGREGQTTVSWPISKMKNLIGSFFEIRLDVDDSVLIDNVYRVSRSASNREVLLVADPAGEQPLEDPAHALIAGLEVLGLKVTRRDEAGSSTSFGRQNLTINWLGRHGKDTCALSVHESSRNYWLVPDTAQSSLEVCECLNKIILDKKTAQLEKGEKTSTSGVSALACQTASLPENWFSTLSRLGFVQLGGELGSSSQSLAMRGRVSGSEVLVFQIPLTPLAGLSYGNWPILVRSLLGLHNLQEILLTWPREDSIFTSEIAENIARSNVPVGESILEEMNSDTLPPLWNLTSNQTYAAASEPEDNDPLPWIRLACMLVGILFMVEIVFGLASRWKSSLLVLAIATYGVQAKGQVTLSVVGSHPDLMADFARDLAARTSITLDKNLQIFGSLGSRSLREPWLFVSDTAKIVTEAGTLAPEISAWIRKGGLLVIQSELALFQLEKLTSDGFFSTVKSGVWKPIAPDHELMRSFYLLESLPTCQGSGWNEFRYDGRTAILAIPYRLTAILSDQGEVAKCENIKKSEQLTRVLVNLFMISLATDYKKDQIHLPEILKRLR